jgi:hypothetical protein
VWSAIQAIAEAVTALASLGGLYFAYRTVTASVVGVGMQRRLKEVEKKERRYRRFVLDPAHDALLQFEKEATTRLNEAYGFTSSQQSIYHAMPAALAPATAEAFQRVVIALRERLRFIELTYGPGEGVLWGPLASQLEGLEDGVIEAIERTSQGELPTQAVTRQVRDGVAVMLHHLAEYDMRAHSIKEIPTPYRPRWLKSGE